MASLYCIQSAPDKPLPQKSLVLTKRCNGCKAPFKLLDDIDAHIPAEDIFKTLFGYPSLKFYPYMGNTFWVMSQNSFIKNVMEKMNDD